MWLWYRYELLFGSFDCYSILTVMMLGDIGSFGMSCLLVQIIFNIGNFINANIVDKLRKKKKM